MAKLSRAQRNRLPSSVFGLPKQRKYPMPNKSHARNAKARAAEEYHRGLLTLKQYQQIVRKANSILRM
jgi:hypothetical protein